MRLSLLIAASLAALVVHAETPKPPAAKKSAPKPFVIPPDINGLQTIIAPPVATRPLKVAIYDGKGAPVDGIATVERRILSIPGAQVTRIKAEAIASTDLSAFDVVAFTGGSGSGQAEGLGEAGKAKVREFVKNGGGYFGVCAGAYLACSKFKWSLGLMNAQTVSSKWQRGRAFIDMEPTAAGQKLLGEVKAPFKVRYANGPIIKPFDDPALPAYTTVALFRSEVAENGTPVGVMVNSPAQALSTYGKGRVFISSPHPENTPGLEHLVPIAVLWAAGLGEMP